MFPTFNTWFHKNFTEKRKLPWFGFRCPSAQEKRNYFTISPNFMTRIDFQSVITGMESCFFGRGWAH